jgi:hypothetical protein
MTDIIIITYETGVQAAYFKNDPSLTEILISQYDYIHEINEVPFSGRIQTDDERTIRDLIRKVGKSAARDLIMRILEDKS